MQDITFTVKNVWPKLDPGEQNLVGELAEEYKAFLNRARTERETIAEAVLLAQQNGFVTLRQVERLRPGDKVYEINRGKAMVLAIIGSDALESGGNIVAAHIDSPRLDLKPVPLYEEEGLALFKTHYYGGIKKYQWLSVPLAIHGIVVKQDGTRLELRIGDQPGDPVFTVSDLLPHLAKDQMDKKLADAVPGENLNILVGNRPSAEASQENQEKEPVRKAIAQYLYQTYGLVEEDLVSAEIELVPAYPACDVGLDRSMVGGYGQDDRICAFAALKSLMDITTVPRRTVIVLLADKEEIGSEGNTGMKSRFLENFVAEAVARMDHRLPELAARRMLGNSRALSADVNAAFDPTYKDVMDKNNAARLGCGVVLTKYTGSKGKLEANDAHAEFVAFVRRLFNEAGVAWQPGELGKVDQGGGGTVAHLLASYGMDVLDCGPGLLSMHSPFEVASKVDLYMAYKGYKAFLSAAG
ncbi:MAG: aminopeptidase [Peptococcaceae bacterium]|nr:aminopeptidase [Peptococcaceae bacterium]